MAIMVAANAAVPARIRLLSSRAENRTRGANIRLKNRLHMVSLPRRDGMFLR
jgi:hypothetical protein